MKALSVQFATTARLLGETARSLGLAVPSFRSPPRVPGRMRTLRRHKDDSVTVSLVVRDRPWSAVVADMIESFIVANRLEGVEAEAVRDRLWRAVAEPVSASDPPTAESPPADPDAEGVVPHLRPVA